MNPTKRPLEVEPGAEGNRKATQATATSSREASSPALVTSSGATGVAAGTSAAVRDEARDAALRKLARDVAELRMSLSRVSADKGGGGVVGAEGESGAVRKLTRDVAELRAQLSDARKEQAMTRSALRRLQDQVDGLAARGARR